MANYQHKIDGDVAAALRSATFEGGLLRMPQMDRATYAKAAKVLEAVGGKWSTRAKGFPFTTDPRPALLAAVDKGAIVDERKARQAFFTPDEVARRVCMHASLQGCTVLEPSAGHGAIVKAALEAGASSVHAVEIDGDSCGILARLGPVTVYKTDFMEWHPAEVTYDRIVMNPPFTKGTAGKHIVKAYDHLRPGGRLVAIMPPNRNGWFDQINAEVLEVLPAGTFKASGTNVETMIVCAVKQ